MMIFSHLKDQYELLTEEQRLNTQKINELFDMLELKYAQRGCQQKWCLIVTENEKKAYQIIFRWKKVSLHLLKTMMTAIESFLKAT